MITDLAGNSLCGTSYEQPGDHMISICGVYYLDYVNGIASGPITTETIETVPIDQFGDLVDDCLSTGLSKGTASGALDVRYGPDGPVLSCSISRQIDLTVHDATGRLLMREDWNGSPLPLRSLPTGVHVVQASVSGRLLTTRISIR